MGRYTDEGCKSQCFLLQPNGSIIAITIPNASSATAVDINPAGDIVGVWVDGTGLHSFLRQMNGSITPLDVPNTTYTQPVGITSNREIAGYYGDANGHVHGFVRQ